MMIMSIIRKHEMMYRILSKVKRNLLSNKLTENAGKPKELWKTLRKLGAPSKEQSMSTISSKKDGKMLFVSKSICEIFKDFFANLSTNLLKNYQRRQTYLGLIVFKNITLTFIYKTNNFLYNQQSKRLS